MKLISWNCNMAFRKKADLLLVHQPDIMIIQECEHLDKLPFISKYGEGIDCLWFGKNLHKGMAVFAFGKYKLKVCNHHREEFRMVVPIEVNDGQDQFLLFAIWANNPDDKDGQYVTQVWKAIRHYAEDLKNNKVILAGDFNSNSIWDIPRREGNHSDVVTFLENLGIHSVYHTKLTQVQGKESHPTFYLYRHLEKPYHIDYFFVSETLLNQLDSVSVGSHENWKGLSDHVPIFVEFDSV